jgi:pimeloyl-ACP methyl ester carboxylesterase
MTRHDGALDLDSGYYDRVARRVGLPVTRLPVERQRIVGAMRLRYFEWGTPSARRPTLVLLHGGGLNAHTWDPFAMVLSADTHLIAVDLRGHGASEWSPALRYALTDHVADVRGLVGQLDLGAHVVVGMSLGGFVAMAYADGGATGLAGLALVDVSTRVRREAADRVRDFILGRDDFGSVEEAVEYSRAFRDGAELAHLRAAVALNLMPLASGRFAWRYDRRHRTQAELTAMLAEAGALDDGLTTVDCPVLLVVGGRSGVVDGAEPDRLAGRIPGLQIARIGAAGHNVQSDAPAALATTVRDFVDKTVVPALGRQRAGHG